MLYYYKCCTCTDTSRSSWDKLPPPPHTHSQTCPDIAGMIYLRGIYQSSLQKLGHLRPAVEVVEVPLQVQALIYLQVSQSA